MDTEKATPQETPTPEAVNPSAELEKSKAELTNLTKQLEEKEKGFKSLQQKLSERDKEKGSLDNLKDEIQATREEQKLLTAYVASLAGRSEDDYAEAKTRKEEILKTFEDKEKQRKENHRVKELQVKADDIRQRVEALGFTSNDDEYWEVYDVVQTGNFQRAEVKLKKLEERKKVAETPKETEDQKIDKLVKERLNKILEEKGLLVSETGSPSGSAMSYAQASNAYSEGRITREQFDKFRK